MEASTSFSSTVAPLVQLSPELFQYREFAAFVSACANAKRSAPTSSTRDWVAVVRLGLMNSRSSPPERTCTDVTA